MLYSRVSRRQTRALTGGARDLTGARVSWPPRAAWAGPETVPVVGNRTSSVADQPGYGLENEPALKRDASDYFLGRGMRSPAQSLLGLTGRVS